jgi:hypothetical protein
MTLTDGPYPEAGARGACAGWEAALDKLEARLATGSLRLVVVVT